MNDESLERGLKMKREMKMMQDAIDSISPKRTGKGPVELPAINVLYDNINTDEIGAITKYVIEQSDIRHHLLRALKIRLSELENNYKNL